MRGHRHPSGFDALIAQAYRDDEICLAHHGLSLSAARSIVSRLIQLGAIVKRTDSGRPADKERRAEMMRANPNNHPANQMVENDMGGAGMDRTKQPIMRWEEIAALYRGRRYQDVHFRVAVNSGGDMYGAR